MIKTLVNIIKHLILNYNSIYRIKSILSDILVPRSGMNISKTDNLIFNQYIENNYFTPGLLLKSVIIFFADSCAEKKANIY